MTVDLPMLRTSERKAFKRCVQQWWWSYRDGLTPRKEKGGALWFGTGIHLALEEFYIPGKIRGRDPRETWEEFVSGQVNLVKAEMLSGDKPEGSDIEWMDAGELGTKILTNYLATYGQDQNWDVISPEQTFNVVIPKPGTQDPLVNYVGTFDLVARDLDDGNLYLWDHKGLRMSEQVMTPNGWVKNGDLSVGDHVIGSNGLPTKVTGVYDLGMRQMYRVSTSDGSFVDTTDDHLWTLNHQGSSERVRTTKEVMAELAKPQQNYCVTLPENPVIEWPEVSFDLHPYVLGVALGDGCFRDGCRVSNPEQQIREELEKYTKVVAPDSRSDRCMTYRLPDAYGPLKRMGLQGKLSSEKFVPEEYLYGSTQQRRDLLAGLLDTDGSVDQRGRTRFISTSGRLKQAVEHLVRSLGGLATSRKSASYYVKDGVRHGAQDAWCVNIVMEQSPFRLQRQRDRFKPDMKRTRNIVSVKEIDQDLARCIRVDAEDSLYVTKDCIVTHNTAAAIQTGHLPLDDQAGSYWAVATHVLRKQGLITNKEQLKGIVYNFLMKSPPDKRPVDENGKSRNNATKGNYVEAIVALELELAKRADEELPTEESLHKKWQKLKFEELQKQCEDRGLKVYGDVSKIQPARRLHRETVYRTSHERRTQIKRIGSEAMVMDMFRYGELPLTKNPTKDCQWDCDFRDLCEIDESGGDTEEYISVVYKQRNPYSAHQLKTREED